MVKFPSEKIHRPFTRERLKERSNYDKMQRTKFDRRCEIVPKVKVSPGMVFERHEKKYRLSEAQYLALRERLEGYMQPDQYGRHTICSLYFDTPDFLLIRRSLSKPKYKEKLRLRSYGLPGPDTTVYLELKKKLAGVTYKRRVALPYTEAQGYLLRGEVPGQSGQILREIDWFRDFYKPEPRVLLFYERIALYGVEDPELRVTFDTDIRWRMERFDLSEGDEGRMLLAPGERLMEIKVASALPFWLARMLSEMKIYPTSFSKYGNVYREYLKEEESLAE